MPNWKVEKRNKEKKNEGINRQNNEKQIQKSDSEKESEADSRCKQEVYVSFFSVDNIWAF